MGHTSFRGFRTLNLRFLFDGISRWIWAPSISKSWKWKIDLINHVRFRHATGLVAPTSIGSLTSSWGLCCRILRSTRSSLASWNEDSREVGGLFVYRRKSHRSFGDEPHEELWTTKNEETGPGFQPTMLRFWHSYLDTLLLFSYNRGRLPKIVYLPSGDVDVLHSIMDSISTSFFSLELGTVFHLSLRCLQSLAFLRHVVAFLLYDGLYRSRYWKNSMSPLWQGRIVWNRNGRTPRGFCGEKLMKSWLG